jgi:hypothetical protein
MKTTAEVVVKHNNKRNSKSFNDQNRSTEGKLARRANVAFKQRRQAAYELSAQY